MTTTEFLTQAWHPCLPDHLSASQFNMFDRCPEQYRRRYVLGEKERPGSALVLGSAVHRASEYNLVPKIESHEDAPLDEVLDAYTDAWKDEVEQKGGNTEIKWDANPAAEYDTGVRMMRAYHTTQMPKVQPVAVEGKFLLEIPGLPQREIHVQDESGSPIPPKHLSLLVEGYIDFEQETTLTDIKTSKSKPQNGDLKPQWRIQDRIYRLKAKKDSAWHVLTKTATTGIWTPENAPGLGRPYSAADASITMAYLRRIAARMNKMAYELGPDRPWDGDGLSHAWACNFCGWQPTCAWWGAATVAA